MENITTLELVGLFESIMNNDEKIDNQKSLIKMVTADSNEQFKKFADEKKVKAKDLKAAYKYYKQQQEGDSEGDSDYLTLVALVDMNAENEKAEAENT